MLDQIKFEIKQSLPKSFVKILQFSNFLENDFFCKSIESQELDHSILILNLTYSARIKLALDIMLSIMFNLEYSS